MSNKREALARTAMVRARARGCWGVKSINPLDLGLPPSVCLVGINGRRYNVLDSSMP